MLPVYIYGKRTQENPYYFDKELPNKDDNNNEEMKDNKIDKENKENILKLSKVLASNKVVQTLPI